MVRDWRASDYAVFTEAFDSVWGYEVSNDPENPSRRITAEVYVAGALMRSDFIKVAETEDGKPGVLLCAAFSRLSSAARKPHGSGAGLGLRHSDRGGGAFKDPGRPRGTGV